MQAFLEKYPPEGGASSAAAEYLRILEPFTRRAEGLAPYNGCSFGGGIYRLYAVEELEAWTARVQGAFPDYAGRILCFGRDWLCNQFCLDRQRSKEGEASVLLFEIGTGKVLKIPETFEGFHSELIDEDPEAVLAENFFGKWRIVDSRPLPTHQCAGYKVPLFLGGQDTVSNLERADAEVYWHLTSQLLASTRGLAPGTPVNTVTKDR
jgi:hypothetical protein